MHVPQSATPTASPMSYVSAKLSQRGQSPLQWSHQHPPAPTAAPWVQCVPLPHVTPPIFAEPPVPGSGWTSMPAGHSMYYPPVGQFAPSMPPVPLPRLNQPSPISSSSSHHASRSAHSSRSSHTSSQSLTYLHPLLHSQKIAFLISSYPFSLDMISVPQDLNQHTFSEDAFYPRQTSIKIKLSADKTTSLEMKNLGSLSVSLIVQSLHEHLHAFIPREQFAQMQSATQAIAQASFRERIANNRYARGSANAYEGIRMLDVLGYGAKDVVFVGLIKGGEAGEWVPVFKAHPRRS
ncbi:hypothetical protein FB451DRAFT_1384861 [Mycena latifolia]|nr:hypothetical protein FB451DRAFT_1384861 [Mycena latifolia]